MNVPKAENRRIDKIRIDAKLVTIEYNNEREYGERDTIIISSHEKPVAEFREAMKAMIPHVADILEIDEAWLKDAIIRSVSFTRKQGFLGATVSVIRPIDMSNRPLNFTTPLLFNDNIQHDGIGLYSNEMHDALLDLIEHAYRYLDGNREAPEETGNLFEQNQGPAGHVQEELVEPESEDAYMVNEPEEE